MKIRERAGVCNAKAIYLLDKYVPMAEKIYSEVRESMVTVIEEKRCLQRF